MIKKFTSKSGKNITLRYMSADDTQELYDYINTLSKENTYIRFSGEIISMEEEIKYVQGQVNKNNKGEAVNIVGTYKGKIIGYCGVDRNTVNRTRSLHVGELGLSVSKEFREDGIGYELAKTTIAEAKKNIQGLRIISLSVYESNALAHYLYTKLGFVEYGTLPKGILHKGEYVDEIGMYLEV